MLNTLEGLMRMVLDDLIEHVASMQYFSCMDINIGSLPTDSARNQWLVHVNTSMRQRTPHSTIASHKQDGAEAGCIAHTGCDYGTRQMAHRIVNRQSCGHYSTRRTD